MTRMPSAIVIGAGIAGLSSAIALGRAGYDVRVIERAAALAPIGAALSMWANAVDALDLLGVGSAFREVATPIDRMGVFTPHGKAIIGPFQVIDRPYPGASAFMVTRTALQSVLLAAIDPARISLGVAVSAIEQDGDGVTVKLADGSMIACNLAVVADGIWSATAAAIVGGEARHAGYGGVLALSDSLEDRTHDRCAFEYWGHGERFGLFDIGAGRRYWFYMRNEALPNEANQLTHSQVSDAATGWMPSIAGAIAATPADRLIPFSIHAKPPSRRLGQGRILCVGDAAHAMEPNLGQGACQAIEDAVALGAIARIDAPGDIVPAMERLRLKRIADYVQGSAQGSQPSHSRSWLVRGGLRLALGLAPARLTERVIASKYALPDYEALARQS